MTLIAHTAVAVILAWAWGAAADGLGTATNRGALSQAQAGISDDRSPRSTVRPERPAPKPQAPKPQAPPPSNKAPGAADAKTLGQPKSDPLKALLSQSDTSTTLARARLRDNLYAMLATSDDAEMAKRVAGRIEKLWLASGSDTVDLLMQRASKAMKQKKLDQSLKFLDAVVDLAPDFAEGWNRRAFVYYKSGAVRRAAGDLRRVLALDPNHFKALHGLATIMAETGDEASAMKAYGRLLDVHPYWPGAQKAYDTLREKVRGRGI